MISFPDELIVLVTHRELHELLTQAFGDVLEQQVRRQVLEQRYSSAQAAAYLGCRPHHLQALYKRGLAYEKGRPNYYRLSDLRAYCASRRSDGAAPVSPLPHP